MSPMSSRLRMDGPWSSSSQPFGRVHVHSALNEACPDGNAYSNSTITQGLSGAVGAWASLYTCEGRMVANHAPFPSQHTQCQFEHHEDIVRDVLVLAGQPEGRCRSEAESGVVTRMPEHDHGSNALPLTSSRPIRTSVEPTPCRCLAGDTAIGPSPMIRISGCGDSVTEENRMWPAITPSTSATRDMIGCACSRRASTRSASVVVANACRCSI